MLANESIRSAYNVCKYPKADRMVILPSMDSNPEWEPLQGEKAEDHKPLEHMNQVTMEASPSSWWMAPHIGQE